MDRYDFPTTEQYTKDDVQKVQSRLLEMGTHIAGILERNEIPYMLALGSLLGAIRHRGFIPWDDDFDIFIFEDHYDEALEALRSELSEDYFLEDEKTEPLYFHGWAHVKDLRSETICSEFPQDNSYAHKGINVDLYRIKRMKMYELQDYLEQENKKYLYRRREKGLINEEEFHERICRQVSCDEIDVSGRDVLGFMSSYKCHHMEIDDVFPLKTHTFENSRFFVPNKPENVLSAIYGEYMKLPPFEKRTPHYSAVTFL